MKKNQKIPEGNPFPWEDYLGQSSEIPGIFLKNQNFGMRLSRNLGSFPTFTIPGSAWAWKNPAGKRIQIFPFDSGMLTLE